MPKIIYYPKPIKNGLDFADACYAHDANPTSVVCLFPYELKESLPATTSNQFEMNLFNIKKSSLSVIIDGLHNDPIKLIGRVGYPSLGIPSYNLEELDANGEKKYELTNAIADIYRALGAGFDILLMVREHILSPTHLQHTIKGKFYEPRIWLRHCENLKLAEYYIETFNKLEEFLAIKTEEERKLWSESNIDEAFIEAYQDGQAKRQIYHSGNLSNSSVPLTKDAQQKATHSRTMKPSLSFFSTTGNNSPDKVYPSTYTTLYKKHNDPLKSAKAILEDYTKHNSYLSLVLTGHWNRHHIAEVHNITKNIGVSGDNGIHSLQNLLKELEKTDIINPRGSLARRIAFLQEKATILETADDSSLALTTL